MDHMMNDLCSDNYDSIREMLPPQICKYVQKRASPSIVLICVSEKDDSRKDRTSRPKSATCTGFIIDTSASTLVLTCASFLSTTEIDWESVAIEKLNQKYKFKFKFYDEEESLGELVYKEGGIDLALFEVKVRFEKSSLHFVENEDVVEKKVPGLTVHSVSHPVCHRQIQPFTFTSGYVSKFRCLPISCNGIMESDNHWVMYHIALNVGSSGSPIMINNGDVVAIHSNHTEEFNFGVGLGAIKLFLANYFGISSFPKQLSANVVLSMGLKKKYSVV